MAEETTISTPVENASVDTSSSAEPETTTTEVVTDTSTEEPTTTETSTAGTETNNAQAQEPETLYAGKYKSIEELEKGYKEAEKSFTKASEYEKKYNELLQQQKAQQQQTQAQKLQQAQMRGFNSVEQQEIADKVQLAEFEYYANNLAQVHPDYAEQARENLLNYYNTANKAYLNEAKRYFSSEFIENVARATQSMEQKLNQEYASKRSEQNDKQAQELATALKAEYTDFLSDIATNDGKSKALKAFCDVGSINSKEDMQIFQDIYSTIAKHEREQAIKEYEAQKAIEATKQASQISSEVNTVIPDKAKYTDEEVGRMSMEQFDKIMNEKGLKAFV